VRRKAASTSSTERAFAADPDTTIHRMPSPATPEMVAVFEYAGRTNVPQALVIPSVRLVCMRA
jgi:hypothetical protein